MLCVGSISACFHLENTIVVETNGGFCGAVICAIKTTGSLKYKASTQLSANICLFEADMVPWCSKCLPPPSPPPPVSLCSVTFTHAHSLKLSKYANSSHAFHCTHSTRLLLRHPQLSSTCANSSQTVITPPHTPNWNSTHSTWIHQPELHLHTHSHTQTAPSWESHGQIPLLNVYRCWRIFHSPAPLFAPRLSLFLFFSSLPDVKARRECYCNAERFIQDCKYWQWWLPHCWSALFPVEELWGNGEETTLSHGCLTDKVSASGWGGSSKSFYIRVF